MIFLLYGEDKFRRSLRLDSLKKDLGLKEDLSFIVLEDPEIDEIQNQTLSLSFFVSKKTILIKDSRFLAYKSEDREIEALINILQNLPQENTVIFYSDKVLGTLKVVKAIKKITGTKVEEYKNFGFWETEKAAYWLKDTLRLDFKIASFAVDYMGSEDTAYLYCELSKLLASGKELSEELIRKETRQKKDIFKFIKSLALGKKEDAILELERLREAESINLGTLALIDNSLSNYLRLKLLGKEGLKKEDLASCLGVSASRLNHLEREASEMKFKKLSKIKKMLLELEFKNKTGRMELSEGLRLMIHNLDY
jgi:DNA polymerase III delta subunit